MKGIRILLVFFMIAGAAQAQDPEFSQYYAAPLYLNPAFAGTSVDHRFMLNYRNQWPNIAHAFETYALSYDYNLDVLNSGLGLLVMTDKAGSANLRSTVFNFQYAYKVPISDRFVLSTGLNFGVGSRSIDFNNLVFYQQLDFSQGGDYLPPPSSNIHVENTTYFDFGAGMLLYSRKVWLGFSTSHLNRPNRSLLDDRAQIPVKTSIHGGIRLSLGHRLFKRDRTASVAPSFVYRQQDNFDQLDLGTYFFYEPVVVGLWYRGIPLRQNVADHLSHDAVVVVLGFQLQHLELGYSYDITVSELGGISGGAHEVSLKYKIQLATQVRKRKRERFIPCPTFVRD